MTKYNSVKWNGVTYPSIEAAAHANWITPEGMYYRIRMGYTCDEHIARNRNQGTPVGCVWNGKRYPSINAAARATGMSESGMRYRVKMGYVCESDMKRRMK